MSDERPKMNDVVFVNCDLLPGGDARYVDEGLNAFADAALEFKDKVSAAGYNASALFLLRQDLYNLIDRGCVNVFMPHNLLSAT